ncbi:MAG: GldG family protein [bacterium]|nr:GldG family protein [bacterium]
MKLKLSHIKQSIRESLKVLAKTGSIVHSLNLYRYTKQTILLGAIALFVATHLLLSFVTLRLDLSKGAAYTLSKSSKQILRQLELPTIITLYTSNNLPPRVTPIVRDVIDLLREYDRASGKIQFTEVSFNPTEQPELVQKLAQIGIVGIPVREQDQNEVSLTQVYFGVTLTIGEEERPVSEPFDIENLEYNISSSLYTFTNTKIPTIGIIGTEEGLNPQLDQMGIFKQIAGSQFVTEIIPMPKSEFEELDEVAEPFIIPSNIDTLIIVDTAENIFSPEVIEGIKVYLQTGSALVFVNGVSIDDSLQTGPGDEDLISLISTYGITVENNLVLSPRSEFVNVGSGGFSLFLPYPFWAWTPDVNTETNYTGGISRITFPWGSALTLSESENVRYLAQSSPDSWVESGALNLNPQSIVDPRDEDINTYILAAESDISESGKLAVIGSSRFIQNNFLSRESQNIEFVLNLLNNYASDGALSGIRRRAVTIYPLPQFSDDIEQVYKYATILLMPLIFGVYGGVRLWKRNKTS